VFTTDKTLKFVVACITNKLLQGQIKPALISGIAMTIVAHTASDFYDFILEEQIASS
jgi:hypothetical protein